MYHMRQEVYTVRLPVEAIARLRTAADVRGLRPTQLLRTWIIERLGAEPALPARAAEAPPPYGRAGTLPDQLRAVHGRIEETCRRHGVATLKAFGSVLGPSFGEASDIDLAVTFQPMPGPVLATAFFALEEDLARILDRRIDLVDEIAIKNPIFKHSLDETAVLLYVA